MFSVPESCEALFHVNERKRLRPSRMKCWQLWTEPVSPIAGQFYRICRDFSFFFDDALSQNNMRSVLAVNHTIKRPTQGDQKIKLETIMKRNILTLAICFVLGVVLARPPGSHRRSEIRFRKLRQQQSLDWIHTLFPCLDGGRPGTFIQSDAVGRQR